MSFSASALSENVSEVTRGEDGEDDESDSNNDPEHGVLIVRTLRPEVDQDDSNSVESVKQNCGN
jgi:hypothetical protein